MWTTLCSARDIRIVVPYAPGGAADRVARVFQTDLSNKDYNFIVEYKTGGGGATGAKSVAATKNDTVLCIVSTGFVTGNVLSPEPLYDISQSFTYIDYIGNEPLMLVVKSTSPIKSYRDLITVAKTKSVPYGSGGVGSSGHIVGSIIANNNPNFIHIPYKGGSAALMDLLAGNIKLGIDSDIILNEFVTSKQLIPLAVVSKKRIQKYPNVPTLAELGVNDYGHYRWFALVSNADADPAVINYVRIKMNTPEFKKKIEELGLHTDKPAYVKYFFSYETMQTERMLKKIRLE